MKKIILPALIISMAIACSTDDPMPATCQPTVVEEFDGSSTFYYFDAEFNGNKLLSSIEEFDGTMLDYTYIYQYTEGKISKVSAVSDNTTINYSAEYDGQKLIKLSGTPQGFGVVQIESRLVYSGDNLIKWEEYIADPNTGNLYQYLHYAYTYNNVDLSRSEFYIDEQVIVDLIAGNTPGAYNPTNFFNIEYSYGSEKAQNPLFKQYNLINPEMSLLMNVPTALVQKDADGNILGSIGYDITFNEQGFPILADSGNSFLDFSYDCN